MKKEMPKIKVSDLQTGQVLFECAISESEKAYSFAAEMEELGLDVKLESPTLTDTLSTSLGLSSEAQAAYKDSMEEEMEHHEGSCCFKENDPDKLLN